MRRLDCGSVIPGCDAVFLGETDQEVLVQVAEHARETHGINEVDAETVDQIRVAIREA